MGSRWLITGAGGQFGSVLLDLLVRRGESTVGLVRRATPDRYPGEIAYADILDHASITKIVNEVTPAYVVHAAAIASAHTAYQNPALAKRTNVDATAHLARVAATIGARFTFVSTDLVFDGTAAPYDEDSPLTPLSVYGRTKADAETRVLDIGGVVVRPAIMYGIPVGSQRTVFTSQLNAIATGSCLELFEDQFRTPIALEDAAAACVEVTASAASGVFHLAGPDRLSRFQMGQIMARALGVSESHLVATRQRDLDQPEPRPADVSLSCRRFTKLFGHAPGRPMSVVMQDIVQDMK